MKVLPLALTVLAALLATIATTLYITTRSAKARVEFQLDQATAKVAYLDAKLAGEKALKDDLQQRLLALDATLGETKSKLTAAELRQTETARDLTQTRELLAVRERNEQALLREIATLKRDLTSAQQTAEDLDRYQKRIVELQQTVALLQGRTGINATAMFTSSRHRPAAIVTVGPENAFVVISYGGKQGAQLNQRLIIRRGTELLATVLISDVRENFSIAQVEPASLRGALRKGDSAVLNP